MCVHTIDPSVEGPPSSFADEYTDQLFREFQHSPDRVSDGIPQFDVLMLGLDADGKAAGLALPPTPLVLQPFCSAPVAFAAAYAFRILNFRCLTECQRRGSQHNVGACFLPTITSACHSRCCIVAQTPGASVPSHNL